MVVPLHTLPGWTSAPNPPWLEIIGLLLGLPLAFVLVVTLIGKFRAGRNLPEAPAASGDEPLWLGGPSGPGAAIPGGERIALPASVTGSAGTNTGRARVSEQVGGASARW